MIADTQDDLTTLRQELKLGLLETESFADFCQQVAGRGLESEVLTLQAAARALHAAAEHQLAVPAQRGGTGANRS